MDFALWSFVCLHRTLQTKGSVQRITFSASTQFSAVSISLHADRFTVFERRDDSPPPNGCTVSAQSQTPHSTYTYKAVLQLTLEHSSRRSLKSHPSLLSKVKCDRLQPSPPRPGWRLRSDSAVIRVSNGAESVPSDAPPGGQAKCPPAPA